MKQGAAIEKTFSDAGITGFGLTKAIGDASPFALLWIPKLKVHSTAKIWIFYLTIATLLAAAAVIVAASKVAPASKDKPKSTLAQNAAR